MENYTKEFSGREFSSDDLELIKSVTSEYPKLSPTELAATICELIGWVQTNGKPKLTQCLSFLYELEKEGVVKLPERKKSNRNNAQPQQLPTDNAHWLDTSEISECNNIQLDIVRPGEKLQRWRYYLNQYHCLKDPHVYGAQIRYMIKSDTGQDLGCLLFSAASWALASRDKLIGWTPEDRKERLHLIVNNSRFLLLPWVHINCLASRALSLASKRLPGDWLETYSYAPVLIETFVDVSKYKGTCYKAANWLYIGETLGRGRNDYSHEQALSRKAIFLYPLQHNYINVLNGITPCKLLKADAL